MSDGPRPFAVVVNYNGGEVTRACVDSLRSDPAARLQVVIVDNASGTSERARLATEWSEAPDVEVLKLPENLHFAGGVNAGALRAIERGATHLLVLNNDTVVEEGCVGALLAESERDPRYGLVGPLLLDLSDRHPLSLGENYAPWSLAVPRTLLKVRARPAAARDVGGIMGSALMIRSDCFLRVGPYREDLLVYYEEVDWCLRARAAGYQPRIVPEAIVLHDGMRGFAAGLQPYAARLKARNQVRLALYHGGPAAFLVFLPIFLLLVLASSILYALRFDFPTVRALWRGVGEGLAWVVRGHP